MMGVYGEHLFVKHCVFLLVMFSVSSKQSAAVACSPNGWCVAIDVAAVGSNSTLVGPFGTQKLCHQACDTAELCVGSNYEMATGWCELLHVSDCSAFYRVAEKPGWVYSRNEFSDSPKCFQDSRCFENDIYKDYPIFMTRMSYPSSDLTQARNGCAECGMQLCSLAQLKESYEAGLVKWSWGLVNVPNIDAKVNTCRHGGSNWFYPECFYRAIGTDGIIPNTPRPGPKIPAHCCGTSTVAGIYSDLEWQLVFKGKAGTSQSLYGMWTETSWDVTTRQQDGHYRNSTLYDAWSSRRGHINYVKMSLLTAEKARVELIFCGMDSSITSWFSQDRLLSSPWYDLNWGMPAHHFSINGYGGRRFFISQEIDGSECLGDTVWLVEIERPDVCTVQIPGPVTNYPVILFSTTLKAFGEPVSVENGVGTADYMTIHVNME